MHSSDTERVRLLVQIERLLERPIVVLSLVWVVLAVVDLTRGLSEAWQTASTIIWIIFIFDFVLRLIVAPRKSVFLQRNWLVALSLAVPALRLFRAARAFRLVRVARGIRFARLLSSMNRGLRALRRGFSRHAAGYVATATLLVLFSGAAGMMAFEREGPNRAAFETYATSLWWTAMLMTTIASEAWPRTGPGRALTLFISLYALGVFGYITATLASVFVEQSDKRKRS